VHRFRVCVVLAVAGLGAVWPATGAAQILYRTPDQILRLTATSGSLAWAQERAGTQCFHLYRRRDFGTAPQPMTKCRLDPRGSRGELEWVRLAGPDVFWDESGRGNTEADHFVYSTTGVGKLKQRTIYTINCGGSSGAGKTLGPLAAGAPYYSVFTVTTDGQCGLVGGTGVVRRIVVAAGGAVSHPLVPGAPGPAFLAVAAKRLLEVPAVITPANGIGPTTTLELRGDHSGRLRWSTPFTGTARAVALSGKFAVTLVQPPTGRPRIRAYANSTGTVVHALVVRPTVLPTVSISRARVIFAYPRWIMIWDVRDNLLRRLRRTPHAVRNLATDGRLVVWNTQHTIRGILLPRSGP
jgi:hypothetical protein